jgi:hypothetical protein
MSRLLSMCTFNEFREALGLPSPSSFLNRPRIIVQRMLPFHIEYKTFTEWNTHEGIATAASELHNGNIDDLELLGMVRFGSVRFFEGFWRTQNRTIGSVHRLWRTLDRTVGSVQNGQVLVLKWSEPRTGLIDVCRIHGRA